MSIIRVCKRSQYVAIDHAVLSDLTLSWEAKGLHVYLLSRPDDWQVNVTNLVNENLHAGRDKIYRILAELIAHGYAARTVVRSPSGRITRYDYEVFEGNLALNGEPVDNFSLLPEKPYTAKPFTVKPTRPSIELNLKEPGSNNYLLNKHWFPSLDVLEILRARGIEKDFIERLIPEFILFWSEYDPQAGDWDRRFVLHVLWLEKHPNDSQNLLRLSRSRLQREPQGDDEQSSQACSSASSPAGD